MNEIPVHYFFLQICFWIIFFSSICVRTCSCQGIVVGACDVLMEALQCSVSLNFLFSLFPRSVLAAAKAVWWDMRDVLMRIFTEVAWPTRAWHWSWWLWTPYRISETKIQKPYLTFGIWFHMNGGYGPESVSQEPESKPGAHPKPGEWPVCPLL